MKATADDRRDLKNLGKELELEFRRIDKIGARIIGAGIGTSWGTGNLNDEREKWNQVLNFSASSFHPDERAVAFVLLEVHRMRRRLAHFLAYERLDRKRQAKADRHLSDFQRDGKAVDLKAHLKSEALTDDGLVPMHLDTLDHFGVFLNVQAGVGERKRQQARAMRPRRAAKQREQLRSAAAEIWGRSPGLTVSAVAGVLRNRYRLKLSTSRIRHIIAGFAPNKAG